jgi:hypothetical protein
LVPNLKLKTDVSKIETVQTGKCAGLIEKGII